jgi:cellulose synthase (UDP-forming)
VFDADFIPQQRFLECSIGLLEDPGIGLVQTPQCFMNADPVMRNLGMERWLLPDEESFYRWIEPVRDGWGAVVCAGTSFVVKREALQQVGGFVEQALSEDFVTGIALRAKGWRLVYLQQKLSAGLAAESMLDFVRQRQRWAAGTLQSLHLESGPLRAKNLSIGQRLAYLEGVIHWLNNIPRLILMLMPLSYGLLGITPINISVEAILYLLVPLWGTMLLGIGWLNRGSRAALLGELTSWVLTVPLTLTVISSSLGRRLGFQVTPKHQTRSRAGWSWALAAPLLLLSALNATNLILLLFSLPALGPRAWDQGMLGLVWACLNLLGTLIALRACWDPAIDNASPWFAVDLEAWIGDAGGHRHPCRIRAISEQGAELSFEGSAPPLVASSQVQWDSRIPALHFSLKAVGASAHSVSWEPMDAMQRRALMTWLYGRDQCWVDRIAPQEWKALLVLLKRLLQGRPDLGPLHRSLIPIAPQGNTSGHR